MRKWSVHVLALVAVMNWGVAQAQQEADGSAGIPPSPQETESVENPQGDNPAPPADAPEDAPNTPGQEQAPPATPPAPVAPETTSGDSSNPPRTFADDSVASPPADVETGANVQISPRIRNATANLDISDATRARYRWENGEWWFQMESGQWKYYRDSQWQDFDPTTYQPPAGRISGGPPMRNSGATTVIQGSVDSRPPRWANSYNYNAPSYRPVPPATGYYGSGYGYRGSRYYDGPRGTGPYRPAYRDGYYGGYGDGYHRTGYGPRGSFYDYGNDRYYGRGAYGRGYSIDGDRYRGGVIGSEIGGRLGGRSGAIIGGAIGAEAAD